jgi:hypothetical protein
MNTLKTLAFAALLSSMSLVSVAQTTAGFKPAAAQHATHKVPTSKAKSKHVKPKPKVKTVAHSAKKPVAKKSGLTKTSLAKKKAAAHKKAASSKHGITVSR